MNFTRGYNAFELQLSLDDATQTSLMLTTVVVFLSHLTSLSYSTISLMLTTVVVFLSHLTSLSYSTILMETLPTLTPFWLV